MPNFTFKKFNLFKLTFLVVLFFVSSKTRAQFPYSQSFKNSTAPGVLFGGSPTAFLTGGVGARDGYTDANGSGYLRLTNNQGNQKGIVYSDAYTFPSAYGMTITFEYFTHSKTSGSGADGIAFILFDATASPVEVGAFGGSLGYAQRNTETGFSKGYLGVGIDEFGNFSAANEGKTGGAGVLSSNVTLRGAGTGTTGYRHLISSQTTALASPFNVAGNDRTAVDNTKAGYRKMEVILRPRSTGGFFIDVYLTHGSVRDLIINNFAYTDAAPSNLKFAISSSTGGSNNFHEIRNLNITVDQSTLLTPVANADSFTGCVGVAATSGDITANDNGSVNTLATVNKSTVDLDTATAGIQTSNTVAGKGTFTYDSATGNVTFTPLNNTIVGPVSINYTFNDTYNKTSSASTITYNTYTAITNNTITAPSTSTFCTGPQNPGNINGSNASGGTTTLAYQWESSSDNVTFNPISGATNVNYNPSSVSASTYYRRIVTSGTCKNTSNVVAIIIGKASATTATAATATTCNSFTANWNTVPNATSYGLSVSTNSTFSSHVANFDGRDLTSSNSYTVTGLTSGQTYYFKVWSYNSCGVGDTSSNVITVTVGNGSVAGTASATQTICSGTSPADLTLTGYTGTIQWQSSADNSTFTGISGATSAVLTSSQMGTLTANRYYRAVVTSGSCSSANTSSVLITVSPVPVLGTAAQSAAVCDGSTARINLTGLLANSTSTISYSIDGVAQTPVAGITADAVGAGAFDSAVLTAANNGKILKITAVTTTSTTPNCTSSVNKDVTLNVNASSVGGSIASAQTICSGTSPADLVLSGNTGTVTKWQKASDVAFTSPTDIASTSTTLAKATIGNLAANTYFRAIVQNGVCSAAFSGSVLITVNATPSAPSASAQTFCSVDAKKVSDLVPSGASYKWYNASSAGTLYTGTETLATGTYYVSQTSNGCESSRTAVTVTVNTTPSAPSASAQVFCSADSKKVSDLVPSGASYKWYSASSAGTLYAGTETLATGTYYVSQTTNGCESSRTAVTVTVNTTPAVPTVGTINQPTCSTATGSFTIGNYNASNTYTITPSAGVTRNAGVVTAPEGNYTISASANGCTSANASFAINAQPVTPASPTVGTITQPTCSTATGSFTIGNYNASNTYTITPSAGVTRNAGVVTAPEGNYTISASANGCTSANASFTINAQPVTPAVPTVGTITQPTCSTVTGSFTIGNYSASNTYTITPSAGVTRNAGVVTAQEGSYTISASANGCTSANASFTINAQPVTPASPTVGTITQPTCSTATGSFTIGNYSASNTYTITPSAGVTRNAGVVTAPEGNYTISASANGCTSGNASFTIYAQPVTPASPTVGTITQPTCSTATGSFTITNYNSNYTYLVSPSAGVTITGNTISAPSGSYVVKASLSGCESTGTNAVVYSQICAVSETLTPAINGLTGGDTTASLIAGDKLNNSQAVIGSSAGQVIISPVSIPAGFLINSDGTVKVPANTKAGNYNIEYSICEVSNPSNCSTAVSIVQVTAPVIDAVVDTIAAINGNIGGTTISLTTNDTLNGNPVVIGTNPGEVTFTLISTLPTGLTLNADRTITVASNTPAGNYNVQYRICENNNPSNCDTVTSIVPVTAGVLVANADTIPSVTASNTAQTFGTNVFDNDTKNGSPLNPSDVTLTVTTADPKGYLSLDTNGNVVLGANAPAGNYELTYTICEKLNPSNCSSNTVEVTVGLPVIDAVTETTTSINGNIGGTTASLTANDTLNGNLVVIGTGAGQVKLTLVGTIPSGLTLNADGTVTVAPNTLAGTYDVEYSICEITNPSNCDTVISKVVVGLSVIDAVTETTISINGNTGGTTASLTANDTLNGNPVVIGTGAGQVKLTLVGTLSSGLTLNADGTVTVAPNTPAGTYDVEYSICEITNPSNCDTVISKVVVGLSVIDAVTETTASINGNIGGTTISLTTNDTLNGNPVIIGTGAGQVKLTLVGTLSSGLTLNADGTVTVAPNTPAGTYDVEYSICEITNPSNCDTVISKVVVGLSVIDAVTETTTSINGNAGGTTASLTANDTLNGNPVVIGTGAGQVKLTLVGTLSSGLTLNADGTVTVAPNTPAGTYDVEYSICEITNPSNCDTVISKVVVGLPVIDAVTETTTSINGNTGGTTASLTANDTLNGNPFVIGTNAGEVKLTLVGTLSSGLTLNADGTVTVAPNTPAGTYDVEYSICEITNPSNCDTVISKVVVGLSVIDAVTETTISINGNAGGITASLTANDTLNGNPVVIGTGAGQVKLTLVGTLPGGLTLNADGTVTVAPNTPAETYDVEYSICEITNLSNCDTVISKVVVGLPVIDAVTETTTSINGNTGGTTASLTANDTLNGNPVVIGAGAGQVKLTLVGTLSSGLTLNADATVTVAPNTPAGTYDVEYSICEITNPSNCDTVISKVVVGLSVIDAVSETTTSINGNTGGTTASLTANDTLNGNPVVIGTGAGQVKLTLVGTLASGLTLNADATVTVAPNTPAGTYDVEYSICEITNPSNCDTVISKVVVGLPVIDAVTETTISINGNTGGTTASLTANDTLNGNPVVIGTGAGQVKLTLVGTLSSGLTLNADGTVTVAPNTPAGTYDVEYSICEITNPSNCDTVISKVVVTAGNLVANADTIPSVTASNTAQTLGTNVFDNDTKNGSPLNPSDVNLTVTTADPKGYLSLDSNGNVVLGANAPAGNYELTYTICEKLNPSNCSSNTVEVTVGLPVIDAVTETTASINGNTGGTTASLTANDTLNGNPVVIGTGAGQVKLTLVGTLASGLTLNADGTVTVASNTPAGTYDVEYSICEITNPSNCDTALSKVVVGLSVIDAVTETTTSINGNTGGTTASLTANDTLNGNPVVIGTGAGQVKVTLVGTLASGLTLNADGTVTVAPNTQAGTYDVEYSICEITNPSNCDTVISKVVVGLSVIDAVTETTTSINGNIGGTTASLTANDTLNGNAVVIGTGAGQVKQTLVGTLASGLTLNADGTVTVAPNTPAGTYDVEYSICEITNPSNCDTVISKVVVTAGNLVANADTIPSVTASNTAQTLGTNVFDNDTKNGSPLNPSDVNLTVTTADPKGYLSLDTNGNVVLGANAPAGNYELTYTICEKLNPTNCSSNTVEVTVGLPVINAVTETTTSINGNIGGTTASLTANDTLNGNPVVIGTGAGQVKLTLVGTLVSGLTLNADGTVTVASNTPAGTYDVEYSICEITNPSNCDTVISKVVVTAGNLVANADTIPSVTASNTAQTLGTNVFDNDTKNGFPLNPSDVNLTVTTADPKGYLSLDSNGNVVLGANAPAGNYELTYTICEKLNPSNCSSNTVEVTVGLPVIDAVTETTTSINGNTGGTTTSLIVNDTLNGNPVVIGTGAGQVKLTLVGTLASGLTLNADGTVTVAPNTPAGTYDVEYSICEITNPSNCDTVISKVAVTAGNLVANTDTIPSVTASNTAQTLGTNVFDNDTKNGLPLNPSDVNLTVTTADPKGYLSLDSNGNVVLGANAPAGNYELTYTICEKLNPTNCSSNTVEVTVGLPVIDAITETTTSINGNIGGTTISLTTNDTLNGNPVIIGTNAGEVKLTLVGTLPSGLTLNTDGTVTVAPNTPAGNYNVEYSICEVSNPTNCDSVISVVVVNAGTLVANEDIVTTAVGINIPQTLINIFTNDTKNGQSLVPSDVNLTVTTADPKGYLVLNPDGTVTLNPNAPAGTYELTYTICEKLNPSNCSSNNVKVTVTEPKMTVIADSYCANNVPYVNYSVTPDNFTTTNLLTINWIDSANNVVATQTNLPLSGSVLWPGATVDGRGNGEDWPGWVLNNDQWTEGADGFELTRPGVTMQFVLNPTVNVSVTYPDNQTGCNARPPFSIKANDDNAGPLDVKKDVNAMVNIFTNDILNGIKPNVSDVVLTTVIPNANLILNPNGSISVLQDTPNGEYKLTYQICEAANTSNCSQAVVTVMVVNSVEPITPAEPQLALTNDTNISVDGINGSLEFVNVLDNDLLNGQPINPADVTVSPVTINSNFEWNADGTVNVKPNTPGGNYALTYQVCVKGSTTNCATAVLNVFVEVPAIAVIKTAVFNDENQSGYANAGETITYTFTVTNTGNVPLTNIKITDPLTGVVVSGQPISLAVNESNNTNFSAVYKITQEDINRGKVSNQASVQGQSQRGVVVEDLSDDMSNSGDNPTVLDVNGCVIKVFNAFSPNGDAKNARFYIQGLECYPNNTVEIYNRWGVLVFSIDQYNNQDRVFVGYSDGRSTVKQSEGLPVGTYFYILKYKDNDSNPHEQSGYLYINK
ncbi:gliding motility-associated C-terminal domain-containing protein [Flavobacterium artemisiae]|uniref:T9SS type B sorting domain-containing protein n=1 Tax=Flavobacterium artemisiae TaxID=2126556 RepID=UPI00363CFF2F